jgi:predicted nucleic acid-binding protein
MNLKSSSMMLQTRSGTDLAGENTSRHKLARSSGHYSKGSAREILRLIESSEGHVLVLSPYLLSEVADVLRRARIRTRWHLSDEDIGLYCQYLSRVGEEVSLEPLPRVIGDPEDQAVIETAVAGAVTVICTFDAHFYTPAVLALCAEHEIQVMKDVELLAALRKVATTSGSDPV